MTAEKPRPEEEDTLVRRVEVHAERRRRWLREGEPSVLQRLAQIGVLGWTIVTPTLIGLFLGRWLDRTLGSGLFWTAPLMLVGLVLGCRAAWRWMQKP